MPRIPRKNLETSYLHVMVQGIEKRYIFNKENYKSKYEELIKEHADEFTICIIAYCIMDNHTHILVKTNKIDNISKFMHKINFKYAQYYNFMEGGRVGFVFRNRFTSEPILDEKHLYSCIQYIHNNPVKAKIVLFPYQYKHSSYNEYKKSNSNCNDINGLEEYVFADVNIDERKISNKIINKYEKMYEITKKEMNKKQNKEILKKLVIDLKVNYKVTYKVIAEETQISLSKIKRLVIGK